MLRKICANLQILNTRDKRILEYGIIVGGSHIINTDYLNLQKEELNNNHSPLIEINWFQET
jgi:hypothetical protein